MVNRVSIGSRDWAQPQLEMLCFSDFSLAVGLESLGEMTALRELFLVMHAVERKEIDEDFDSVHVIFML